MSAVGTISGASHPNPSTLRTVVTDRSQRRIRAAVTELAIAAAVYLVYWFGRLLTQDSEVSAAGNAELVIDLERSIGAFTEREVQRWAMEVPGVIGLLNRYYVMVHFPATIAFLLWVFLRRRSQYAMIRTWFAAVTLAGLAIHVAFPLAPPRMTPGFVDTLDVFGPDIYANDTGASVANQFAAMPSLHFGWALLVALGMGRVTGRARHWWMAHPIITLVAIVATGNHYWIDAAIAGLLVVAAVIAWDRWHRDQATDDRRSNRPESRPVGGGRPDAACGRRALPSGSVHLPLARTSGRVASVRRSRTHIDG